LLGAPTRAAPDASRRSIRVASRAAGGCSRLIFEPARVGRPATSNRFLTANGTPASGPSFSPRARRASSAAAVACARSCVTAVNALSTGSCIRMVASAASTTSLARAFPSRTPPAISAGGAMLKSIAIAGFCPEDRCRLGVVGQRKLGDQRPLSQRHLQVGFHGRAPFRLKRQVEHARGSIDEIVEGLVHISGDSAAGGYP